MSEGDVCPHCRAVQGTREDPRCWLCRLPLEAPPVEVPPPPRPLPADGVEGRATEAALVAGMVSVGAGALLISGGFGLVSTLIVVLPCAWLLGDAVLSRPAAAARSTGTAKRGPLHPRPRPPSEPLSGWDRFWAAIGTLLLVFSLGMAALWVALLACCAAMLGGAQVLTAAAQASIAVIAVCGIIAALGWLLIRE